MTRGLWIAQKNHLCALIKQVAQEYGEKDMEEIREYAKDVLKGHKNLLGRAIECFESLGSGELENVPRRKKTPFKPSTCPHCGYRKPFCYFVDGKECRHS